MKRRFNIPLLLLAGALIFSCSVVDAGREGLAGSGPVAVTFGAYVSRDILTKAGAAGELKETDGVVNLREAGFGIFGYYTQDAWYDGGCSPDFMYNTRTTYSAEDAWTYWPLKYWPNAFGEGADSRVTDRLSFFAYAPYVAVDPATGLVEGSTASGITSLTRSAATGDPQVKYVSSLVPGEGVDLCWGVGDSDGHPLVDLVKPNANDKVSFDFKHALAALAVTVDADFDIVHGSGDTPTAQDAATHIWIRSLTFEGFALRGTLNLNSSWSEDEPTPEWGSLTGGLLGFAPVTLYDGRRDGQEGMNGGAAGNEQPAPLNPIVVQSLPYCSGSMSAGVTATAVNLFSSNDPSAPVYVIPTGAPLKVTIAYDVETIDAKLAGTLGDCATNGRSVANTFTQALPLTLRSGSRYTLALHLGMTSVKVESAVTEWSEGSAINSQ